jgi:AraC-like DNA-binding protein
MLNFNNFLPMADKLNPPNEAGPALRHEEEFMSRLFEVLAEKAFHAPYSVPQLCRDVGMSSSRLHRKLIALTGKPAIEMIRTVRMERAKQLLQSQSHRPISEIAFECGFNDPDYFSRVFSERFGVAPSRYRKQM